MQQLSTTWDAKLYNDKHRFVYDYGAALIPILNPAVSERILDLGCGSGELTAKIAEFAPDTLGIDSSPEMIAKAKHQFPEGNFRIADASTFVANEPFDAIFSNAALHWMLDYKKVIACMHRNLKNQGRIVVEFGGEGNIARIVKELKAVLWQRGYKEQSEINLWFFPTIAKYTGALEEKGFKVSYATLFDRPTALAQKETGIADWLSMFCAPFLKGVHANDKEAVRIEVQDRLRDHLFKDGKWFADYKRIRVIAHKE